ncbi:MAG: hypothetical protein ICV52_05150 [Microcoleus sp. C1-bin4]|nr:hypothetical protein [Microcoleus sp. C1-bin4]
MIAQCVIKTEITRTYDDGREVMDYELMSKRLNAVIPDETWDALEEIAKRELRTKSQMAAILLGEAIAEYHKRNSATWEEEPDPESDPPKRGKTPTVRGRIPKADKS